MNKVWSFYDATTGVFVGRTFSARTDAALAQNTPAGCKAIEGRFDHRTKCVDVATGQVIERADAAARTGAAQRQREAESLRAQLDDLDRALIRPLAELHSDPGSEAAREKLQSINQRKGELRDRLRALVSMT